MLFPNAHPQNPVGIAAGDHPPENPAVVDDVDIVHQRMMIIMLMVGLLYYMFS